MNDSEMADLLSKLLECSEAQVTLLTAISLKLDDLNLGIATAVDGSAG